MSEPSNLQDRLLSRRTALADEDPDAAEDLGAFGYLRGVRERALMLDLRLKNGNREAFPYALLERASLDRSEGITLRFLGVTVRLHGFHLTQVFGSGVSLYDALLRHRIAWVAETEELRSAIRASDIVQITRIDIEPTK